MNTSVYFGRVRTRSLEDHKQRTGFTIDIGGEVIADGAYLYLRHIAQMEHVTTGSGT